MRSTGIVFASIHSDDLQSIAGGRPPPSELLVRYGRYVVGRSAYRVLLRAARRLRWLKKVERGQKGVHADIYRLLIGAEP